ncbi:phospholipase D-like domain-containing protein [Streptomyces cavernicola]|uniref:phospholipase D n=1 Tax=Streptomyces cavernicola TaxID=3043613 RepID=A0ABT6SK37_9ACTN|nr:phospholipase D-like domain-containing protein [Streptomyces sp. B-S-A6]MDI3408567.1 phospholipase D-like domain-containing protein [Streptomyces sp. B-S-A6]
MRPRDAVRDPAARLRTGARGLAVFVTAVSAAGLQLTGAQPAGAATTSTAEPQAPAEPRALAEGPIFNDPLGGTTEQYAIRTRLVHLTDSALPGSTIKVAVYHVWETTVVDALLRARARGVNVQVLLDESSVSDNPTNPSYATLKAALGSDRTKPSFALLCPAGKSCLGDPQFGKSIMHNKFWLFSAVEGGRNVVVQTTTNSTPSANTKFFNDALQLPDNSALYGAYSAYFAEMTRKDWAAWRYRTVTDYPYKAYYFPRAGTTVETDTVHSILNNVTCTYKDSAGVTQRTRVRVAVFKLTRQVIADKLVALRKAGCSVYVTYAETDSAASQGGVKGTWEALHTSGGPSLRCYNDDRDPQNPGERLVTPYLVHNKYLLIDGVYVGKRNKVSFTGSGNHTAPALRENDEAMVKVDDDSVHDAYRSHFDRLRSVAWPGVDDSTDLCKGVRSLPQDGERRFA